MRPWTLLTVLLLGVSLSPAVESAQTVQEVRVHWDAYVGGAPQGVQHPGAHNHPSRSLFSNVDGLPREAPTAT